MFAEAPQRLTISNLSLFSPSLIVSNSNSQTFNPALESRGPWARLVGRCGDDRTPPTRLSLGMGLPFVLRFSFFMLPSALALDPRQLPSPSVRRYRPAQARLNSLVEFFLFSVFFCLFTSLNSRTRMKLCFVYAFVSMDSCLSACLPVSAFVSMASCLSARRQSLSLYERMYIERIIIKQLFTVHTFLSVSV